mgnify:FL=1
MAIHIILFVAYHFHSTKMSDGYRPTVRICPPRKIVILADITDIIGDYTMEQYNTDKSAVHDKILKTLQKKFGADYIVDVNIVSSLTQ